MANSKTKTRKIISEADAKRLSYDWMMTCFKDKILKKYCLNTGDYRYIGSQAYAGNCRHLNDNLKRELARQNKTKNFNYSSRFGFDFVGIYPRGAAFYLLGRGLKLLSAVDGSKVIIKTLKGLLNLDLLKVTQNKLPDFVTNIRLNRNIINDLPDVLAVYQTGNGHLEFVLSEITSLTARGLGTAGVSRLEVTGDDLATLGVHYLYTDTGIVKAYTVRNSDVDYTDGRHLISNCPIDFIEAEDKKDVNIIGRLNNLNWLDFAYRDYCNVADCELGQSVVEDMNDNSYEDFGGNRVAVAPTYSTIMQNYNARDLEDLACNIWKRLKYLRGEIDFSQLHIMELGQLSALITKLTKSEAIRVAKWYVDNRANYKVLSGVNTYGQIYVDYLKAKYGVPLTIKEYKDYNWHYFGLFTVSEIYLLLKYYKRVMGYNLDTSQYTNTWSFIKFMREFNMRIYSQNTDDQFKLSFLNSDHWRKLYEFCAGRNYINLLDSQAKIAYFDDMIMECALDPSPDYYAKYANKLALVDVYYNYDHHLVELKYDSVNNCYIVNSIDQAGPSVSKSTEKVIKNLFHHKQALS